MSKNGRVTVQGYPVVLRIHLCVKKNNHMKSLIKCTPDVTRLFYGKVEPPTTNHLHRKNDIVIVDVIGF